MLKAEKKTENRLRIVMNGEKKVARPEINDSICGEGKAKGGTNYVWGEINVGDGELKIENGELRMGNAGLNA